MWPPRKRFVEDTKGREEESEDEKKKKSEKKRTKNGTAKIMP